MAAPKSEVDQKRDEALRRMLNTPHKPHQPAKAKKAAPKKRKTK
jgi:hypothetical protein